MRLLHQNKSMAFAYEMDVWVESSMRATISDLETDPVQVPQTMTHHHFI